LKRTALDQRDLGLCLKLGDLQSYIRADQK